MESIRILQDIFERLYALSVPMRDFLEDELSALSRNWWCDCVEPTLGRENTFMYGDTSRITLDDVDIYYLTKIILKNWPRLRENSCGKYEFTQKHRDNFRRLQEVRNRIAHPEHRHYTAEEYKEYLEVINTAASFFGKEIAALIQELHQQEKAKILGIIQQKVLEPAIACKTLDQDIKKKCG